MNTLFNALTTYRSVEGSRWDSQDDAIICSILHLIGGGVDDEAPLAGQADVLFDRIKEYNLLDHTFQQMVRLGYLEAPQLPAPAETVSIEEERPVIYDLMDICGGKADGWLTILDGTSKKATDVRRTVLLDYQYNSHDVEGIEKLNRVLKYIAESIKPVVTENMCEPVIQAVAEPISFKYTIQQLVDRLNREGGDFGTDSVIAELKHHNEKYREPLVPNRLYSPTYVLDHHEYEFLCELYSLKSESHYDGYGNARTLFGLFEQRKHRGGPYPSYGQVLQDYKAHYNTVPATYDGISAHIRSWFYQVYGS